MKRRVVVTGLGAITPVGNDVATTWRMLLQGKSGAGPITRFDPSNFSVSCRQVGPISVDLAKLPEKEEAFSQKTSIFFKRTRIYRLPDAKRHVIVYVAVSSKIINGSPANSVDVVPIQPWSQTP